ncbi:peptidase inhibitor family I36 protein [Streptomyces sp. NPDC056480]|uniref:peptidase inhibitor family I36 protein n=1 Tax=Streptomyces sp. NPDC056480 TaxID=3345833 RepID=UPI0036C9DF02
MHHSQQREEEIQDMFKRIASITLSVLALTLGSATVSSAADGVCGSSDFCLYKNANYSGGVYDYSAALSENTYLGDNFFGAGTAVNNNASSSVNKHVHWVVKAYESAWQGGDPLTHRAAGTGCLAGQCPAYSTLGWADNAFSSHDNIWVP